MIKKALKAVLTICLCGMFMMAAPQKAEASVDYIAGIGVETSSSYMVKIDAPSAVLYQDNNKNSGKAASLGRGETYEVLAYEDGWALVDTGSVKGYLRVADCATMVETTRETVDEQTNLRNRVLDYALQFVGNPYVWGGTDPNTGADCSGFTSYVMRQVAGVSLSHSSRAQAGEGKTVSEPQPGDLVFYSSGGRINHVAIYMGNGQIVHASTEKVGIVVSDWDKREPVKVVDVLS